MAVTEAVELARRLCTDDSPRYLNDRLSGIADIAEDLCAALSRLRLSGRAVR